MHPTRFALPLLLVAGFVSAKDPAAVYVRPDEYPIERILPSPPRAGSDEEKADRQKLLDTVAHRTEADIQRAKVEEKDQPFLFGEILGKDFTAENLPKLAALFAQATTDAKYSLWAAKGVFKRPRADTPEAQEEEHKDPKRIDYSFPSSHSTRAFLWATLLSELFPEQSGAIHLQARRMAWDRVLYGKHYPADVLAGRVYGEFLAGEFLANEKFMEAWKEVEAEVKTFRSK